MTSKPPLERVQESEKPLERIMLVLPGFRGYKLREQRREADRIVRDYIYQVLERARDNLTDCFRALSDLKLSELLEQLNVLTAMLDRVAERINHASYGYSGFFDSVKIEEPELDNMLTFDTQLMDLARRFSDGTAALKSDISQGKVENVRNSGQQLEASIDGLEKAFDLRRAIIEGVKV